MTCGGQLVPERRSSRRRATIAGLILALALAGAVLARAPTGAPTRLPGSPPYLTVFLIDGLSETVFERELTAGRLPALQRLIEEGRYVPHGIASFPSMTGFGFYPFLTGHDAAGSGVLGLRWFDGTRNGSNFRNYVGRSNRTMDGDFAALPPTLFECFPDEHSYAINSYANRGVDRVEYTTWPFIAAKYRDRHWLPRALARLPWLGPELMPVWEEAESTVVRLATADLPRRPKVQWITFSSPDTYSHVFGPDERYAALIRAIDGLIAAYRRQSEALGLEADRLYLVASDHGVVAVSRNVDLRLALRRLGLRAWRGESVYFLMSQLERPRDSWDGQDAVIAINGNTMAYVYLLSESARRRRGEVARSLQASPGTELVIWRADRGAVTVQGSRGESVIQSEASGLAYSVRRGVDPLGYCEGAVVGTLCDGTPRSPEAWLAATHDLGFPYAVPRLFTLMSQQNVGDFVVTAAPGYDLAADYEVIVGNYLGGHGGLRADQLRVPYVLSGAGIAPGRQETARAEDMGVMLTGLLGCPGARPTAPSPAGQ
jgi:hypothetical protein